MSKPVYDLGMFEELVTPAGSFVRVPGGWILERYTRTEPSVATTSIFIPFISKSADYMTLPLLDDERF